MSFFYLVIKDFFRVAVTTWVVLVAIEVARPGVVQRLINLEYFFYVLLAIFLMTMLWQKNR